MSDQEDCAICFEKINKPHFCVPCRHVYCNKCISSWKKRTCPLCREKIKSYKPVASYNGDVTGLITLNHAEIKMLLFVFLMVIFMLIDFPSHSGFMLNLIYPLFRALVSVLFESLGLVFIILEVPFRSIYRIVTEVMIIELKNFLFTLHQKSLAIGQILLNLQSILYAELGVGFQENNFISLLIRTILIGMLILLVHSLTLKEVLKELRKIP